MEASENQLPPALFHPWQPLPFGNRQALEFALKLIEGFDVEVESVNRIRMIGLEFHLQGSQGGHGPGCADEATVRRLDFEQQPCRGKVRSQTPDESFELMHSPVCGKPNDSCRIAGMP